LPFPSSSSLGWLFCFVGFVSEFWRRLSGAYTYILGSWGLSIRFTAANFFVRFCFGCAT
jgi:hypothetical protein